MSQIWWLALLSGPVMSGGCAADGGRRRQVQATARGPLAPRSVRTGGSLQVVRFDTTGVALVCAKRRHSWVASRRSSQPLCPLQTHMTRHRVISCVRLTFCWLGRPLRRGNDFAVYAVRRLSSEWPFDRMKLLVHRMGECAPCAGENRQVLRRTVWPARHPSINQVGA
jgi:hypothetical protein